MAFLITWPNLDVAKRKLKERLDAAKEHRKRLQESQWLRNERYIYKNDAALTNSMGLNPGMNGDTEDFDDAEFVEVAYAFKDVRYLHAELCGNPPTVQATPLCPDLDARRAARGGDQVCRSNLRRYHLQEVYDLGALDVIVYGTGISETLQDPELGEVVGFNKKTGEVKMSGDLYAGRVSVWDFYPNPDATSRLQLGWTFKRFRLTPEAFLSRWPKLRNLLADYMSGRNTNGSGTLGSSDPAGTSRSGLDSMNHMDGQKDTKEIELYEYWEEGMPENGQLGRYAICFDDGTIVVEPRPSPMALPEPLTLEQRRDMRQNGKPPRNRPKRAVLPFHIWTDVDVPGRMWGKSFLEYAGPLQELMNNLDSATLELVKTHGIMRVLLPAGARLKGGDWENDPARIYELESNPGDGQKVDIIPPAGVPPALSELRGQTRMGVDDMAGVGENNFGNQSREQSGFSMQYAVNQSKAIRRRLFNKSVMYVESLNWTLLRLACYHWDEPEFISVLGEEHAYDSVSLKGLDFDGGFKLEVEYGTSLPLDPELRRDTLMKYMPLIEKSQVPPRQILKALKFGDFNQLRDPLDLAEDRQGEIFEEIEATGEQVQPRRHQDHENMLAWAKYFVMTSTYRDMPEEIQNLIDAHIDLRAKMAAELRPQAEPAPVTGGLPGMAPTPPGGPLPPAPAPAP